MSQTIWLGGIHSVTTVLTHHPDRVLSLYISENREDQKIKTIIQAAKNHQIAIHNIDKKKLEHHLPGVNHQGVAVQFKELPTYGEHDIEDFVNKTNEPLFLILDGVQDPHNLGACLRSADAAGVTAVIIPKDRAVGINQTVRKVACGAAEVIPVIMVTNLARAMTILQDAGVFLIGLAGETDKAIYDVDLKGRIGLVLGAEEHGMRRLTRDKCDIIAAIPMHGSVESLNVSVATGISLFEAVRQRKKG